MSSPERIYLQDANGEAESDVVTWCVDMIDETDTTYVREDIHAAALARVARLEETLRGIVDGGN